MYIGDRLRTDAIGAVAAGLTGVWIDRACSATAEQVSEAVAAGAHVIHTLAELPELLAPGSEGGHSDAVLHPVANDFNWGLAHPRLPGVPHSGGMDFAGALPMDAPDPAIAAEARLSVVPFPVYELRPQPSIARHPITGFAETTGPAGVEGLAVLFSYTLWAVPRRSCRPAQRGRTG